MSTNYLFFVKNCRINLLSIIACMVLLSACGGGGGLPTTTSKEAEDLKQPVLSDSMEERDDPIASGIALEYAGFTKKTPSGFWYADTKKATAPTKSFGVFSKTSNLMALFLVFDDNTATEMLPNFAGKPPYTEVPTGINRIQDSEGEENLKSGDKFHWILSQYPRSSRGNTDYFRALVGGFPSTVKGKSVLVVARAFDHSTAFNHRHVLFIIDTLMKAKKDVKEEVVEVKTEPVPEKEPSTKEDIDKFLDAYAIALNENLSLPEKIEKVNKDYKKEKGKEKKWTGTQLLVGIDSQGKLKSLGDQTKIPTEENKLVIKALIDAVQAVGTTKDAPTVEGGELKFDVRLIGSKIVITKQSEDKF